MLYLLGYYFSLLKGFTLLRTTNCDLELPAWRRGLSFKGKFLTLLSTLIIKRLCQASTLPWSSWTRGLTFSTTSYPSACLRTQKHFIVSLKWFFYDLSTVKRVYNRPPLGLKKVAIVEKWLLFRGWSLKSTINIKKLWIRLAVVDRWPLLGCGC